MQDRSEQSPVQEDPHELPPAGPNEGPHQSPEACLERIDPADADPHLATQHLARYAWAASLMPRARVLDCGCGLGYGSAMLADAGAGEVLGIDISAEAIEGAGRLYPRPGVTHRCVDAITLEEASVGRFDVIVCLEVIEHVAEPQKLLDVLKSLLAPGGVLAVSCPDDEAIGVDNPFHIWEAGPDDLRRWLKARFAGVSEHAELHTMGTEVRPMPIEEDRWQDQRSQTMGTGREPVIPGRLFLASEGPLPMIGPLTVQLADGLGYVRDLLSAKGWLDAKLEEYRGIVADLEASAGGAIAERDRLRARVDELERENAYLKTRVSDLQTWADEQTRRLADAWAAKEDVVAELQARDEIVEEMRRWAEEQTGRVQELWEAKTWLDGQLQGKADRVEELEALSGALSARLETEGKLLRRWAGELLAEKIRLAGELERRSGITRASGSAKPALGTGRCSGGRDSGAGGPRIARTNGESGGGGSAGSDKTPRGGAADRGGQAPANATPRGPRQAQNPTMPREPGP